MRVNERIRVPRVRVVGADGDQVGILPTEDALALAQQHDLDLVEVAAQADPPVCRIMDYGKFKYEQDQRQKEARKKQSLVVVKEMKMRPKISVHDYETKKGHVVRFLKLGAKVKVTIMFRGREMIHPELGERLLNRLAADVEELARVDTPPKLDGRNMTMVLGPLKAAVAPRAPSEPTPTRPRRQAPQQPRREGPGTETAAVGAGGGEAPAAPGERAAPAGETEAPKPRPRKITRAEGG